MFYNHTNHIISTFPAPILYVDRNRQTSELLVAECQNIIATINTNMLPNTKYAFETKRTVNMDCYSNSFTKELKQMITGYYTFHRYNVTWTGTTICISWAPIVLEVKTETCCTWSNCTNAVICDDADLNDLKMDTPANEASIPAIVRSSRANNLQASESY